MKIQNSHVDMASSHNSYSSSYVESATIERVKRSDTVGAIMKISSQGEKSYKESMEEIKKEEEKMKEEQENRNLQEMLSRIAQTGRKQSSFSIQEDMQITMLKRMLDILNGKKAKYYPSINTLDIGNHISAGETLGGGNAFNLAGAKGVTLDNLSSSAIGRTVQVWERVTATSGRHLEYENTTFTTQGTAQTEDGRSISFNVDVTLGRSLSQRIDTISAETYTKILTDPLVINLNSNITSVSDQKFMFDIDSDGREDEISFVGQGSGFLAYDKNGDGIINDGSELFGTSSGDGFKDLSAYDDDGNGWIDENDEIFSKLVVWTKDSDGNDRLIKLKDADVGAIYLGSADTEFSFKNTLGDTDGVLRKTGIYLKESTGEAGTIAHVDLAL